MGAGDDHPDPGTLPVVVEQRVGLGQVSGARRSVDQGLDQPQLDQHGGPLVARHRLLQRPPQQQDGRVRRPARHRRPGRRAQQLHGDGTPPAGCPQEVGGDLLGGRTLLPQDARGPLVVQCPLPGGQVVVHGLPDERVDERQVVLVGEDLAPAQRVQRGGHLVLGQPGERGDRRQPGGLTEHGNRSRRGGDRARHPAQPQRHQGRDGPRAHRAHRVDVRHVGRDPLVLQRTQQLAQQQRVARGHPVAGTDERLRALTEALPHQHPRRLRGQGCRSQHGDRGVEGDLGEQRVVGLLLAGTPGEDDQHRQSLEPLDQVGEVAERGTVAPLDVVDADHERSVGRRG